MQKGLGKIGLILVAAGLCLTLLLAGAIPVCEAGPEERVVKIGWDAVLTGPLADTGVSATNGIMDYIRYINEQGGMNGVKIAVEWQDTRGEIPRTILTHKRLRERGIVAEINIVLGTVEAMIRDIQRDEIPMFMVTGHSAITLLWPIPWVFTLFRTYRDHGVTPIMWLKEDWTQERRPRVGMIAYDHISARETLEGLKWACKEMGCEFVGAEIIPWTGAIDTSTEWLRLTNKNADFIFVGTCGVSLVTVVKDAKRLGIMKRGIIVGHFEHCFDDALHIFRGDAEGWYVTRMVPALTRTELPGVKLLLEKAREYRDWGPIESEGSYVVAWNAMPVLVEGIRLAIEKVGYENLTGRAVRDGLASIKDFDNGFLPPITMSDECPYCINAEQMYQIQGGRFRLVSDKWYSYPPITYAISE